MWRSMMVFVAGLLATGTQAYAPLQMVKGTAKSFIVLPNSFSGNIRGTVASQRLSVGNLATVDSQSFIPYFTAKLDHTITWDDMAWCLEAAGDKSGDLVRVNRCNHGSAQKWSWIPDGHGRNMIQLESTNLCLDGSSAASIELRECSNELAGWLLEEPAPLPTNVSRDSLSYHTRHVMITLACVAALGALSVGTWLWQRGVHKRSGSMPSSVNQEMVSAAMAICPMQPLRSAQLHAARTPDISMAANKDDERDAQTADALRRANEMLEAFRAGQKPTEDIIPASRQRSYAAGRQGCCYKSSDYLSSTLSPKPPQSEEAAPIPAVSSYDVGLSMPRPPKEAAPIPAVSSDDVGLSMPRPPKVHHDGETIDFKWNTKEQASTFEEKKLFVAAERLLLPKAAFDGESAVPSGEVNLQELEDDQEARTQLFLNADGTVSHGNTDGPPPAGFCGLWQCGSSKFQMTLCRSFSASRSMEDGNFYTVTRVYEGEVNPESTGGRTLVSGRIDLANESGWAASGAATIAEFDPFSNIPTLGIETPPIGYFNIDAIVETSDDVEVPAALAISPTEPLRSAQPNAARVPDISMVAGRHPPVANTLRLHPNSQIVE